MKVQIFLLEKWKNPVINTEMEKNWFGLSKMFRLI